VIAPLAKKFSRAPRVRHFYTTLGLMPAQTRTKGLHPLESYPLFRTRLRPRPAMTLQPWTRRKKRKDIHRKPARLRLMKIGTILP
jgi:hypothetical protein